MSVDQTLQQVFALVVPEAALVGMACVLFMLSTMRAANRTVVGCLALLGVAIAAIIHIANGPVQPLIRTVAPIWPDNLSVFVRIAALATGALLILFTWRDCDASRIADYHACLLIAVAGVSIAGRANDLIVLFLALELISMPTYVMLYLPRANDELAQEAALKYFMLSIMSSAFMLFGFSYLYGVAGTTNIAALNQLIPRLVAGDANTSVLIAAVFVLAGIGFRITAFPFHFYAPDVYQGGPTGTVAFLAFVPKLAGFVALLRLFSAIGDADPVAREFVKRILMLLWVLSVVTMSAGNVMGLLQNNLRRMLAYSGVANAGYMLIGFAVVPLQSYRSGEDTVPIVGSEALLFYLIAYGAMTVGAFAVLAHLDSPDRRIETLDEVAGLNQSHPFCAKLLGIFLISLIGLPLTVGFVGKLLLFMSALSTPSEAPMQDMYRVLAIVGAVNAAIAAFYYVRVLNAVFLRTSLTPPTPPLRCSPLLFVAAVCAAATVLLGVYPKPLLDACRWAFTTTVPG